MKMGRTKRMIGKWAAGALCALLIPLAFAQPPHGGLGAGMRIATSGWHHGAAPPGGQDGRAAVGAYGSRWGLRPSPSYSRYAAQNPYRPVSANAHRMPRASAGQPGAPIRAGSIRADVTRYNEEHGSPPLPSRSRNEARHSLFSVFYRN